MTPTILIVDDDPIAVQVIGRCVEGLAEARFALTGEAALALARAEPPDLVLMDTELGGIDGFEACRLLKADLALADVPVIFVTQRREASAEVAGFAAGGVDFVTKPVTPQLLASRVRTHLKLKQAGDELRRQSRVDGLTGIYNRRWFDDALRREWGIARRAQDPLSLLMVDVDHFKAFNDRFGHPAGDELLRQIAGMLVHTCRRPGDVVTRYGGEEFALLLPQTPRGGAAHIAGRLLRAFAALDLAGAPGVRIGASIGVASCDEATPGWTRASEPAAAGPSATPERLLAAADAALYAAKRAGRAQAWFADPSKSDPAASARWLRAAESALDETVATA